MPFHPPSEFLANCISAGDSICEAFAKFVRQVRLVADQEAFEYEEDGSFTEEYTALICATGCGGGVTTTTGGDVTSTTAGSNVQNYDAAGTFFFTVPDGITELSYIVVAGGGGNGGYAPPFSPACGGGTGPGVGVAAGGGSGEMRVGTLTVTPGSLLTIDVGDGGAAGTNGSGPGGTGGTSDIIGGASAVSAVGGSGGLRGCCSSGPFAGGVGGTGGSGGVGTPGNAGGATSAYPVCANGSGGASVGLGAGAGSAGNPLNPSLPAGIHGAVHLTW